MQWRHRVVALERCEITPRVLAKQPVQGGVTLARSTQEKVRAKQRRLDGRQRWRESFDVFAVDRSGRRREILSCERQSFDSDGEGQGIQTPIEAVKGTV